MLIGKGIIKLCFTLTECPEEILQNRDVQITISLDEKVEWRQTFLSHLA